jgi:hypothetical protein
MADIISKKSKIMAKASGGNQQVEIADHPSRLSQFPSFPAEKLADFPVHAQGSITCFYAS